MSQWPEWMRPGVRVVRGPDWNATIRDQAILDLGTLSYVPKQAGDNKVTVVWDNGLERSYRSGYSGHYELRAYDTQQVGVTHKKTHCSSCNEKPIHGLRFRCTVCSVVTDLCMKCYMKDAHDKSHTFARYDLENSSPVILPPREDSDIYKVYGVFKDSKVIRGPHWHYTSKDGGDNSKGTVMSFVPLKNNVVNGWVRVKWEVTKNVGEYRLGADGNVEVVASNTVEGGTVYADHLPVVGIIKLKNGDKVTVNLSLKDFQQAQKDGNVPGGWKPEMKLCTKETGTIMEVLYDGKCYRVQYVDGTYHIIARSALYRVSGFSTGGVVKILANEKALKLLQEGHGGYNADVGKAKGKLGRVVKVQFDGDMKVLVDKKSKPIVLSPACCNPVSDPKETQKAPDMPEGESDSDCDEDMEAEEEEDSDDEDDDYDNGATGGGDVVDDGRRYVVDRTKPVDAEDDELKEDITEFQSRVAVAMNDMKKLDTEEIGNAMFDAFMKADLDTVKAMVQSEPELLDFKSEGRTILHLACHEGYIDLVKFLLNEGADTSEADEEGDTPLHYAAFGLVWRDKNSSTSLGTVVHVKSSFSEDNMPVHTLEVFIENATIWKQVDCIQKLLENGALPNVKNKKGVIPLHIAIGYPCIDSVQYLLLHGSDVNMKSEDGETCMHDAVVQEECQPLLIQAVLNANNFYYSNRNDKGFNVLKWAAVKNNQAATTVICKNAVHMVNDTEPDGFSALHIAAANDFAEVASILLDQGKANPDVRDHEERAPLHLAVAQGHKRMIEILVNRGADINAQNKFGNTPLHVTQTKTSLAASVRQPLHGSRQDKNVQIVFFLLENGASLDIKNNKGQTPLDLVKDQSIKDMILRVNQAYQKAPAKSQGGVRLPMHWKKMDDVQLEIVNLGASDPLLKQEYQNIEKLFLSSMPQSHIQTIKRVQNPLLWEHYSLKKREFEAKLGKGMANEQQLYHGTRSDLVEAIAIDNFDFRMAGDRVGALYGNGAYFATTAKYSDLYADKNQSTGLKSMFVAKVLVGRICQGQNGMKLPPKIDPSDFRKGQFDTTVNTVVNPTIFCVFDKNQYYPEYVVEYY